uniref:Transmembrane protein n=1 Tax=Caenorhabditis tropicalis TaxID=1561998 RepID=A0A1I7UC46_9PELO
MKGEREKKKEEPSSGIEKRDKKWLGMRRLLLLLLLLLHGPPAATFRRDRVEPVCRLQDTMATNISRGKETFQVEFYFLFPPSFSSSTNPSTNTITGIDIHENHKDVPEEARGNMLENQ